MAETIGWPYPVLYTGCSEMSLMKIALYSTINHSDSLIVAIQPLASLSLLPFLASSFSSPSIVASVSFSFSVMYRR